MENKESTKEVTSFFSTTNGKLLMIIGLIIALLVPLELIKQLIYERNGRQKEMVSEVTDKWGDDVLVYGPILKVPYIIFNETISKNSDGSIDTIVKKTKEYVYFTPDKLNIEANVKAKNLSRGMYDAAVFTSNLNFTGNFDVPDFDVLNINPETVLWNETTILLPTSNLRSIKNEVKLEFQGKKLILEPQYSGQGQEHGLETLSTGFLKLGNFFKTAKSTGFSLKLEYNGSESLKVVPIGRKTTMKMTSNWSDPSFCGNFLPDDESKVVNGSGFQADWKILQMNRPFPRYFKGSIPNLSNHSFGVNFIVTADQYQQNERTVKYGILVITLSFLTFFMVQVLNRLKINIVEYVMIGIAMTLFYTLLLSISEHTGFTVAYLISSGAVISMIAIYAFSFLKNIRITFLILNSLLLLYGYIFVIIRMENYALLSGSVGLFIILALVMYYSRKIDWKNV